MNYKKRAVKPTNLTPEQKRNAADAKSRLRRIELAKARRKWAHDNLNRSN